MLRREFLNAAATLATVTVGRSLLPGLGSAKEAAFADEVQGALDSLEILERRFGSGQLLGLVDSQVAQVNDLLRKGHDSTVITSIGARAYELAGWFYFDAGQPDRARALYKEALFLAQTGGDQATVLCAAADMSRLAADTGRHQEAVHMAQMGSAQISYGGPVASVMAMREAQAWSRLGAEAEALAAVRRAQSSYDRVGPSPFWVSYFTEGELAGCAAQVSENLHRWDLADKHYRRAISDPGLPLRARTMYWLLLARSRAKTKDIEGVEEALAEALPALPLVKSNRTAARVAEVRQALLGLGARGVAAREQLALYA